MVFPSGGLGAAPPEKKKGVWGQRPQKRREKKEEGLGSSAPTIEGKKKRKRREAAIALRYQKGGVSCGDCVMQELIEQRSRSRRWEDHNTRH
jgi:hypothetical protein